ncbi:dihydroneopterin aldolase [Paraliomyxa miuraensis]|uniref:dihydroneopterin aldolase n=1 Tax=Paraliomyxa miuraensis TaxID=376150 RepID=UPI0022580AD4|nr:dihydroneopterin aldolase [Paraliomyxa miuraensis]MCX4241164.1 dihydroneopterin aldolase [Paraliomyxa miuraensis]
MTVDAIELENLRLRCVVGVWPQEREREQPVRVDLQLWLDLGRAGRTASLKDTVDYSRVAAEVTALLRFRRYRLLENAAAELSAMLLGCYSLVQGLELRLAKPEALGGRADATAVRIRRAREDLPTRREPTGFGQAEVLLETAEAGLYLLHVEPGRELLPSPAEGMRELSWLVDGALRLDGEPMVASQPAELSRGDSHAYRNYGKDVATLFFCGCPPPLHEHDPPPGTVHRRSWS